MFIINLYIKPMDYERNNYNYIIKNHYIIFNLAINSIMLYLYQIITVISAMIGKILVKYESTIC